MIDKRDARILIVDDERDLCEILTFNLTGEGYQVDSATNAEEALALDLSSYHLLLLDVMMPGMNGFKLAEVIRRDRQLATPIIFLTAKDTENDLLTGFSLGADDYIAKPFSIKEVQARIQALLSRTLGKSKAPIEDKISLEGLLIDLSCKKVYVHDAAIELTRKELEILTLLVRYPERVFSREEILDQIWKDDSYVLERTIDVHMTRIRKKIQDSGLKIENRSGFGYCITKED